MAVNARGHRGNDFVHNLGVPAQRADLSLVFLSETEASELVVGFDDVVGLKNGGKDRESIAVVELGVVIVAVDTGDFNFFAWFGAVDKIP